MTPTFPGLSSPPPSDQPRLYCGPDSLAALSRELRQAGCRRCLVVSGRSVGRSKPMNLLRSELGPLMAGETTAVRRNSLASAVEEVARLLRELQADGVIAVGGSSAADTARAAGILMAGAPLPQFVVPTTPSTAFVRAGSAVHDDASGERLSLFDPRSRARAVFLHPEFLRATPSDVVLAAALHTLCTAVEALQSPHCDPASAAMLVHAVHLVGQHLPGVKGGLLGARGRLAIAGVLCGRAAEAAGGGLAVALAQAIGPRTHVAQGYLQAILLPHALRIDAPATGESATRIAWALQPGGSRQEADAAQAVAALERLLDRLAIPRRLRDTGLAEADLPAIAQAALREGFANWGARQMPEAARLHDLLRAAW